MPHSTPALHLLALDDIDDSALPRDRVALEPSALDELETSIIVEGLRQPIEVFATNAATGPRYGLISGLRRLTVMRRIAAATPGTPAPIPAFLRDPRDSADAMAQMIAENEIRSQITPWEKGRIALTAVEAGLFDTLDASIAGLYRTLDRHRRARLRAVAEVVEEIGDTLLTDPRALSQTQLTRLAGALRAGFAPVIEAALRQSADRAPEAQWRTLVPIMEEAEADTRTPAPAYRPGRPRRVAWVRTDLHIRRERTKEGWTLRFTGPEATGPLMEDVMDYVEQMFGKGG